MAKSISSIIAEVGRRSSEESAKSDVVDIITFVESSWGLGLSLYPVQRVILKAHYGIALDDNPHGFDLEKPIPQDHPQYQELIDYEPTPAKILLEVHSLGDLYEKEALGLRCPEGQDYILTRGKEWQVRGTLFDALDSITNAINKKTDGKFKAEAIHGLNQIEIVSQAFSTEGNKARLELSSDRGMHIPYPAMSEGIEDYARDGCNFYGGGGGYYKFRIIVTDFRRENPVVMNEADYLRFLYDNGRCNIPEVIPGKERREMVLSVGRRSGKCVVGSTLIQTSKGLIPISKLGDPGGKQNQDMVIGLSQEDGTCATSSHFYNGGVRDTIRIKTRSGFALEGTPNHRIKNGQGEWVSLEDVDTDTEISIRGGLDAWGDEDSLPIEEARSLGDHIRKGYPVSSIEGVMRSTRPVVHEFLGRALPRKEGVLYGSANLLRQLQQVLLNYGLYSYHKEGTLVVPSQDRGPLSIREKVTSVEASRAPVYDLCVPVTHAFMANGMVNHNTLITSCIIAYETYKLISKGNPQKYYGMSQSGVVQLISVATDKDQASLLYREASGHFTKCSYFKPYRAHATSTFASFQSPYDIESYGVHADNRNARYSALVTFKPCVAKGLRGGANILVALDEVAHFGEAGQASADEVYQAVEPATRTFSRKDPVSRRPIGENEGRIIMISSPLGRQGLFYKQFQLGFGNNKAADNLLCIQAPTWEVNPTVPAATFVGSYLKDPRVFETEFGAEFTDRTRGWLEDHNDLYACIDKDARPKLKAPPRMPHFMGLDLALVGDYSAVAIGHKEPDGTVVLDYVERIRAGEGDYAHMDRLTLEVLADWIQDLCTRFYITKGICDQAFGIVMQQELEKRGINQIEYVKHPRSLTSQMFSTFKELMFDKKIKLYDYPLEGEHSALIQELCSLQATMHSKGIITVQAPSGKHDDMSDALVRMVWLAMTQKSKYVGFAQGSGASPSVGMSRTRIRSKYGGTHPSRMVYRKKRWR